MAPQPFIPLPNGAQVEFVSVYLGETVENRLWFVSRFIPIDQDLIDALAVGASSWYRTFVMPSLASELQLQVVRARDWTDTPPPFTGVDITSATGGISGGGHSANVSIRVRFNGDDSQTFRDNSNFIPGIPLSAVNGNYYSTTIKDALFDAYVDLLDRAGTWTAGNDWRWVITSRRLNNAYRTEQVFARTDHPLFPSPTVSPRRRRLP
jgi:hypothetical protein